MLRPSGGSLTWEATCQHCVHGGFHGVCNQDVRNLPAPLVHADLSATPQTVTEPWHLRLAVVCNKALVSHHLEKAVEVAVAFWLGGASGA